MKSRGSCPEFSQWLGVNPERRRYCAKHFHSSHFWTRVTRDEVADPHKLNIWLRVNGEVRHRSDFPGSLSHCYHLSDLNRYTERCWLWNEATQYLKSGDIVELGIQYLGETFSGRPTLSLEPG